MSWTDDRIALVRQMWPEHSATQIAAALWERFGATFTRSAVLGKLNRLGLLDRHVEAKERRSHGRPRRTEATRRSRKKTPKLKSVAEPAPRPAPKLVLVREETMDCVEYAQPHVAGIAFIDRRPSQCAYILDGPGERVCCGKRIEQHDFAFCPEHRALCVVKVPGRKSDGTFALPKLTVMRAA